MLVFVHQKLDDDDNFSIKRFVYKYTYLFHTKVYKILYCQVIWQIYVHRVSMLQDKFDNISVSIDESNMEGSLSMNVLLVKIQS